MGTLLDGRYRLTEEISRGELGDVWRCVAANIGRTAAVKVLRRGLADDPTTLKRIRLGWARPMAKITRPDVIPILDVGVDPEAGVYVLMHYVEGESLREILAREDRLIPDRAMDLVARIADAFEAVHAWSIVHRDLGPSKVLVRPDATVALTPFGLVYQLGGATVPYLSQGRARYLSPEQLMGQAVTLRSDIFSLGVLAYRCLAGRMPFDGESTLEAVLHIVRSEPAPLPPDVPGAVCSIVERALVKDPAHRWPTAAEFAAAARQSLE